MAWRDGPRHEPSDYDRMAAAMKSGLDGHGVFHWQRDSFSPAAATGFSSQWYMQQPIPQHPGYPPPHFASPHSEYPPPRHTQVPILQHTQLPPQHVHHAIPQYMQFPPQHAQNPIAQYAQQPTSSYPQSPALHRAPHLATPFDYSTHSPTNTFLPPVSNKENTAPMASYGTNDASAQISRKRKLEEDNLSASKTRARQQSPSMSLGPQRVIHNHPRPHSASWTGTQHSPVETPSSPEQLPRGRSSKIRDRPPTPHARVVPRTPPSPESPFHQLYTSGPGFPYITPSPSERSHGSAHYNTSPSVPPQSERQSQHATNSSTSKPPRSILKTSNLPPNPMLNTSAAQSKIELTEEQKEVVQSIVDGHNVFFTGSAGCGKSTILKAFVSLLRAQGKKVQIIAPTNIAAYNVGGQTLHTFAGWKVIPPDKNKKGQKQEGPKQHAQTLDALKAASLRKEQFEKFNEVDVLVIDEISMVPNSDFERLNEVMKYSRSRKRNGERPFGGVQVVVTGDFFQLAPVNPFRHCLGCGVPLESKDQHDPLEHRRVCVTKKCRYISWRMAEMWAFCSEAWQECNFKHINLTKIHRQSDKRFISILQRIRRDGQILAPHGRVLLNHPNEAKNAIELHSKRYKVEYRNNQAIEAIKGRPEFQYKCVDHFQQNDLGDASLADYKKESNARPGCLKRLEDSRYEACVRIKTTMRVMLVANIDPAKGLVNGCQGTVKLFEPFDRRKLPCKDGPLGSYIESQIELHADRNPYKPWPIVEFDNGQVRTIYPDCAVTEVTSYGENGKDKITNLLSRTQLPLVAGYAITVHKSQGMTLDPVTVDLSEAFEGSQIYVALSRARSLKGLKVLALPKNNNLRADPIVRRFFDTYLDPTSPHYAGQRPQASQAAPQSLEMVQSSQMPSSSSLPQSSPTPQAPQTSESSTWLKALQASLALETPPLSQTPPSSQVPPSSQFSDASQEWL